MYFATRGVWCSERILPQERFWNFPLNPTYKNFFLVTFWLPRDSDECPFHAGRRVSTEVTANTDSAGKPPFPIALPNLKLLMCTRGIDYPKILHLDISVTFWDNQINNGQQYPHAILQHAV